MDIVLVLLIIFMLFAMNVISNLQVNLPSAKSKNTKSNDETVSITITQNGELSINNKHINAENLGKELEKYDKKISISVYADKKIEYGMIAKILGIVQSSNFSKVNLMINKG